VQQSHRDTEISFVPMPAVDEHLGAITAPQIRPLSEVWKGFTHFADGDVIFAKITPCMENGKTAIARGLKNGLACGSTEFHVLRPTNGLIAEYIWRYLRQMSFRAEAEAAMTGAVGQRRVPKPFLEDRNLPIPPLPEQRRIVAKLDRLSARSAAARDHLAHTTNLATRAKQAILVSAFTGDMTVEWRQRQVVDPNGGSFAEALSVGRQVRWIEEQQRICRLKGNPFNLDVASRRYKPPEHKVSAHPDIASWVKAPIGSFAFVWGGKRLPKGHAYVEGSSPHPYLRVTDFRGGRLKPQDLKFLSRGTHLAIGQYIIESRDVFISIAGTIGLAATIPEEFSGANLTENAARIAISGAVDHKFLSYFLNSPQAQDRVRELAVATGQPKLALFRIEQIEVPIPNQAEQAEIVGRIEAAFACIDRLTKEATRAAHLLDRLDERLLGKAFRGELVPQDPEDEPAEALLTRIREARAAAPKPKRGRRKKAEA